MSITLCDMIWLNGKDGNGPEMTCGNTAYYLWKQPGLGGVPWGLCPECYHAMIATGAIHEGDKIVPLVRYAGLKVKV